MVSMYEDLNNKSKQEKYVPIWHKVLLTLEEASKLFNIGINKLRDMTSAKDCDYVLFVGNKRLIKREAFSNYLAEVYAI